MQGVAYNSEFSAPNVTLKERDGVCNDEGGAVASGSSLE